MEALLNKFKDKSARIAVIGAGYVGLPFAVEAATAGFDTVTYDLSESPALDVLELLHQRGGDISYHDPFVPRIHLGNRDVTSVALENLGRYDCVVVVTNHKVFDYASICKERQLVVDTRNATRAVRSDFAEKIVTL